MFTEMDQSGKCLLCKHETCVQIPSMCVKKNQDTTASAYNPSAREIKTGGS